MKYPDSIGFIVFIVFNLPGGTPLYGSIGDYSAVLVIDRVLISAI